MLEISNDLTGLIFFFCLRSFEESGLSTSTKIKTKTKGVCVWLQLKYVYTLNCRNTRASGLRNRQGECEMVHS